MNQQVCLCSNTTLFTETGTGLDLAVGHNLPTRDPAHFLSSRKAPHGVLTGTWQAHLSEWENTVITEVSRRLTHGTYV